MKILDPPPPPPLMKIQDPPLLERLCFYKIFCTAGPFLHKQVFRHFLENNTKKLPIFGVHSTIHQKYF